MKNNMWNSKGFTVPRYLAREVEIWRCIKESNSVTIGVKWKLEYFTRKLCNHLLSAKEITLSKTGNSKLYDWRPNLKGCSQVTRPYDNYNFDKLIKDCAKKKS